MHSTKTGEGHGLLVEGAKILANALVLLLLLELVAAVVVKAEAFRRRRHSRTTSQFLNRSTLKHQESMVEQYHT